MLKITPSIKELHDDDIGDNLLYYGYNIKHLLKLEREGKGPDDPEFISAYRSFEGEVFENFVYEKLIRYAHTHPKITQFILKGPHHKHANALPNTLAVNRKGQIVYNTKHNEINEFDGLIFTDDTLYFVEMTLVKSVSNLKKRLRKKRALLEVLYPNHEVRALLILSQGATGVKQLPDYCTVWLTRPFSAAKVFAYLRETPHRKRLPFEHLSGKNLVHENVIPTHPFRYYNTLTWVLRNLRSKKGLTINMGFMRSEKFIRYHDLFTKVYLGFIKPQEFATMVPSLVIPDDVNILVALEKEHSGRVFVTYFMQYSRKKLDNITITDGNVSVVRKDPYGVTVSEVVHILKTMHPSHRLRVRDIKTVEQQLEHYQA